MVAEGRVQVPLDELPLKPGQFEIDIFFLLPEFEPDFDDLILRNWASTTTTMA